MPEGTALESAIALATKFAKGPTQAFASSRRMLHASFNNDFFTQTDIETREIGANMTGADGQEGLDAFINKRRRHLRVDNESRKTVNGFWALSDRMAPVMGGVASLSDALKSVVSS